MNEKLCAHCGAVFAMVGDNWYRIDRMHDDRVGTGTMVFCERQCALSWLLGEVDLGAPTPILNPAHTCPRHWYSIPSDLRDRLWQAYRSGGEPEHDKAVRDCVSFLQSPERAPRGLS